MQFHYDLLTPLNILESHNFKAFPQSYMQRTNLMHQRHALCQQGVSAYCWRLPFVIGREDLLLAIIRAKILSSTEERENFIPHKLGQILVTKPPTASVRSELVADIEMLYPVVTPYEEVLRFV